MTSPNEKAVKAAGEHCHLCEGCGRIWWHGKAKWTRDERDAAHRCPRCGCGPYRTGFGTMRDALEAKAQLRVADEELVPPTPRSPGDVGNVRERPKPKLPSAETFERLIAADPDDMEWEAGSSHYDAPQLRFFIEHGVIHDRATGKHVRTSDDLVPHEDGIEAACILLNSLSVSLAEAEAKGERMRAELAASREKFTMHTAHVHAWLSALVQELGIAKEGETVDVATACSKAMDEIARLRDKALTK